MPDAARKRISQAQTKNWAAYRAANNTEIPARSLGRFSGRRRGSQATHNSPLLDLNISVVPHFSQISANVAMSEPIRVNNAIAFTLGVSVRP